MEIVVANIRGIISEYGYKQKAAAEKCGYTDQQFSDMLNGRKTIKSSDVVAICKGLGITPNELFAGC